LPAFYFHLLTPEGIETDEIGLNCRDLDEAYLEACRSIPQLASEFIEGEHDPSRCAFRIADEQGQVLLVVPFVERLHRRERPRPESLPERVDPLLDRLTSLRNEVRQRTRQLQENLARSRREVERFRNIRAELVRLRSSAWLH